MPAGKLGFVFNFITYGGHQIDGLRPVMTTGAEKMDALLGKAGCT